MVVHEGNVSEVPARVGFPCVLKKPDGSFSSGVLKVADDHELLAELAALFEESELVVAQAFTPSAWDWRVGVLGGSALFVARYHMAKGHWQIVDAREGETRYGKVEALPVEDAPTAVVEVAVRAARLMGEGLYGVDVKEVDGRVLVMEVNDNPNLEAGYEDAVLKDALWDELVGWFRTRLDRRGGKAAT
jgi:glutathione synthase/RimK-type ligase-like ATP-grasp enzyme